MTLFRKAAMVFGLAAFCIGAPVAIGTTGVTAEAKSKRVHKHHKRKAAHRRIKVPSKSEATATTAAPVEAAEKPLRIMSRAEILAADPARLERIGRHVMIGFHNIAQVKALVEKRAIAGIFITDHNVRGRTPAAIKAEIDSLQTIRAQQGLPPLIVAADQEGGTVSRLSPPLKRQKSLAEILKGLPDDAARRTAVEDFADIQAAELKRLGVTLNFAPVVDLNLNPKHRGDGETRLRMRAISADPQIVSKVAGWYCDAIAQAGIMCTLKHFPGLGRVSRDTHVTMGEIAATESTLESNDWIPFRQVIEKPNAVMMLGHVRVAALDKDAPASLSRPIIDTLIRKSWAYDGLLITDDFSMGAITRGKGGISKAVVATLNAGSDIILVSYMERHLDTVLSALLTADQAGEIDENVRDISRKRLERIATSNAKRAEHSAAPAKPTDAN